jgi:hypothetical protein
MHRYLFVGVGLACWLWSTPAPAQIHLAWDYARETADAFVVRAQAGGITQTWRTTPSARGSCPQESPDTYCTTIPHCPSSGTVTYSIAAVTRGVVSSWSPDTVTCVQVPGTCRCANIPERPPARGDATDQGAPMPTSTETTDVPTSGEGTTPTDTRVVLDIPAIPTRETAAVPAIQTMPGLPLFQPAASQAPI